MALFGLGGISDMGARYLDKTIGGRFWGVDPLADAVPSLTPYRFAFNNPLSFTDPTGMIEQTPKAEDDKKVPLTYTDGYHQWSDYTPTYITHTYNAVGDGDEKGKKSKRSVIEDEKHPVGLPNEYPGLIGGFMVDTRAEDDPTKLIDNFLAFLPLKVFQEFVLFAKINPLSKPQAAVNLTKQAAKGRGWLSFHEGIGHTLSRHVGKTDADLITRLNSSSKISGASSFTNQQIAEDVISSTISSNRSNVNAWLRSGSSRNLVLPYNGTNVIGRGIVRGQNAVSNLTNARVVLKSNGSGGYNILTAFPK